MRTSSRNLAEDGRQVDRAPKDVRGLVRWAVVLYRESLAVALSLGVEDTRLPHFVAEAAAAIPYRRTHGAARGCSLRQKRSFICTSLDHSFAKARTQVDRYRS